MKKATELLTVLLTVCILFAGCSLREESQNSTTKNVSSTTSEKPINTSLPVGEKFPENRAETKVEAKSADECKNLKKQGFALDKKQTFAVDFAPFEKSCFAVFHNPEFTDPNLGAQYFIYKDGKQVFDFPEQFNGGNAPCAVDGVAFEDLNKDNLTDIIVAGKCGAKSDDYNENMFYVNTGKGFETDKEANMEMADFATIKEISRYLQDRQKTFAK